MISIASGSFPKRKLVQRDRCGGPEKPKDPNSIFDTNPVTSSLRSVYIIGKPQ